MPTLPDSIPADLDTAPVTEALRRRLYDAAVELAFAPSTTDQDEELPGYTPEQCGFTVVYALGRWFAVWYDLDANEADLAPAVRWQVMRIDADPSRPEGIHFSEC